MGKGIFIIKAHTFLAYFPIVMLIKVVLCVCSSLMVVLHVTMTGRAFDLEETKLQAWPQPGEGALKGRESM